MNTSRLLENQFLATKFSVPVASGSLISRPRLLRLLDESLKRPFTLVSAPAGFGKTTLLSAWKQSLLACGPRVAWVSLDEEDNEPRLFWTCVLTALKMQQQDRFTALLTQLQSPQALPLKYILAVLINLLVEGTDDFLLILDDYHVIVEQQVHTTLVYLIEHLPAQLRIIVATRADPPLPLPLLRVREHALEVRTDHLRCTLEETRAFLHEAMGIQLPDETIQEVTARTEGWLVGLQLLRLSLPEQADPLTLLDQISGDQRYILDYLTEEVLQRQPQEVQTFLLSTSILEQLNASLCDAVMEQANSQQMLAWLERVNLFVVSLDSRRQWYRYHALFAEALRYRLEQMPEDFALTLHYRASLWYAEHNQITKAILHAFSAHQWQWVADLIERKHIPLVSHSWGVSEHELFQLRKWFELLPVEVVASRPHLCLTCIRLLYPIAPQTMLEARLQAVKTSLITSLTTSTEADASCLVLDPQIQQKQENLLGEVIAFCALLQSYQENGEATFPLCQQALTLLSRDNLDARALVPYVQMVAYSMSSVNDAVAAVECGLQTVSLALAAGRSAFTLNAMGATASHMVLAGRLHEALQQVQQAMQLGTQPGGLMLPEVGFAAICQAEIMREWNQLDAALDAAEEAISLCQQTKTVISFSFLFLGYAALQRIYLSRRDYDAACSTLQQCECIGMKLNQAFYSYLRGSLIVDQVRLWLVCGELDRATLWAQELDLGERYGSPLAREREEVACVRILLATAQPTLALQRLEPVLERATAGKRWGHMIEIRLLQALAYQMCQQERQALSVLSEAVHLAEPEGYIRSFVDEGLSMEALFYRLRKRDRKSGPTPYLDTLLAAFQQESKAHAQAGALKKTQPLPEPLSERELEVLQLLARGLSNLEIAQELAIVIDTVKRHVSHIFSKLGVQNRVQAVRQARELGLLGEKD